jgi:hypothetical protein
MHWRTFGENLMKIGLILSAHAVAIFRKTPKRVSCNLKDAAFSAGELRSAKRVKQMFLCELWNNYNVCHRFPL